MNSSVPVSILGIINTEKHDWLVRQGNMTALKKTKQKKTRQRIEVASAIVGNVAQMASYCDYV